MNDEWCLVVRQQMAGCSEVRMRVFVVRLNLDALSNGRDSFQFSVAKWSIQTYTPLSSLVCSLYSSFRLVTPQKTVPQRSCVPACLSTSVLQKRNHADAFSFVAVNAEASVSAVMYSISVVR
jgi:hypothetical protein